MASQDDIDWEAELSTYRRTATKGGGNSDDDDDRRKAASRPSQAPPSRPPPTPPSKQAAAATAAAAAAAAPGGPPAAAVAASPSSPVGAAPTRPLPTPAPVALSRTESAPTPSTATSSSGPASPVPKPLLRGPSGPVTSATQAPAPEVKEKEKSSFWKRSSSTPKAKDGKDGKKEDGKKDGSDDDDEEDAKTAPPPGGDDDDEKDEVNPWIEFKDEKGIKLWYNTKTQATHIGATPPAGGVVGAAPRGSAVQAPLDDEEEDEDEEDEDGKPRVRRGEAMVDEVGEPDQKESKGGKRKKVVMTPDKILTSLRLIEKQVELILEFSHTLSPTVCDDLRAIIKNCGSCQKQLETTETVDNRNDVDALIEWNKLSWNFDNKHVKSYRAQAVRVPHASWEYKEWHMPQSFSDWPLPPDSKLVTASVKLPVVEADAKTSGGQSEALKLTKIGFNETDTVAKCVQTCFAKCKGLPGDASDYVLKASGLHDYMDGTKLMFAYEYVRMCLRDNIEVKLSLVRRPAPTTEAKETKDDPVGQYMAKVDPTVEVMNSESHRNISGRDAWQEIKSIPLSEVALPFRIRVVGLDKVNGTTLPLLDGSFSHIWLKVFLFHGQQYVQDSIKTTTPVPVCEQPRWMTWLMGDYNKETLLNQLPRACRVGFILFGKKEAEKDKEVMLGWAAHQLIDQWGRLSSGAMDIRLWPIEGKKKKGHGKKRELDPDFIFRQTNRDNNCTNQDSAVLRVKFDEFAVPVVAPLQERYTEPAVRTVGAETPFKSLHKSQQKRIEEIIESDLLFDLSADDKILIWTMRHHLSKFPSVLPKFLLCVNWGRPDQKNEALRLLAAWAPPVSVVQALELLDAKYADYTVREYAVNLLRTMKPDELRLYLLQITQCLKFEPYHDSPLASFLIERALRHPYEIGHHFFWHLKAELHSPYFCERFTVVLEEYLHHCGRFARELRKQNMAVLKLEKVAAMIVRLKREHGYSDEDAMREYRKEITKLNTDFFGPQGKFQIPLNPKLEATTLIVEKCRYMSSKMVPLWLVFKNADEDAPPIYIIFKSGDDLRQDILTLQILRVMDKMWLGTGLDMRMKPYRVIATGVNDHGEGVGMIEVVLNSDTTSGIQLQYGGGAMGALKMDPIDLFLHDHNKTPALYDKAVQNFIMSCAGYCVATFVLGIGDRHNGNIMVTKDGHLFHIDFGHFLGNFKKKFGVNRERAAFVFTPEMAYVMGGKKYQKSPLFKKFLHLCSESFKVLRGNAITLENLFVLMVSAGMPELMKEEDIHYMRDKLYLNVKQEAKADKKLHAEINKSLDSTYRRIDNMIHNLKHG